LGDVTGLIAISYDVTDRKRIEAELDIHRRSDRQLAAIVSSSADAIFSTSMDGKLVSWNPGAEALFGYQAHEVLGQPLNTFTRPQDRALAGRLAAGILGGSPIVNVE